jgi:hypothetical protein
VPAVVQYANDVAGQWSGHAPQIASSALIWVALSLALGAIRITRRDIR